MDWIAKRKSIEGPNHKTLKHMSKWYLKNGWQVKTPPHLYWGWHGLGRQRFRVVLIKPIDIRGWWIGLMFRFYKWVGLHDLTVENPTDYAKGDWMRCLSETSVEKVKIILVQKDRLVVADHKQVTKVAWIHSLISLIAGLLISSPLWWISWEMWLRVPIWMEFMFLAITSGITFFIMNTINKKLEVR